MSEEEELTPLVSKSSIYGAKERFWTSLFATFVASTASLCFGYAVGYSSQTHNNMKDDQILQISKRYLAWFTSLVPVGAVIGGIMAGISVDKCGRRSSILISTFFYTPGWFLISYASNLPVLFAGRILTGVGVGLCSLAVPLYITEVSSACNRGRLGVFHQLGVTSGIFLAYLVGIYSTWQQAALIGIVPVFVMAALAMMIPETPRWLLANKKRHLALQELQWLRGPFYDIEGECFEIQNNLDYQTIASLNDFTTPGLFRPLMIGAFLLIFQQMCGINAVTFFDMRIFLTAGLKVVHYKEVILFVALAQVVTTAVSYFIIDKIGRRVLLMFGSFFMSLFSILLGVFFDIADFQIDKNLTPVSVLGEKISHSVPLHDISWLPNICVIGFIIVYSLSWGPIPWLIMSEIFPPRARGLAGGFVTCVGWTVAFVVTRFFYFMLKALHEQGAFWVFAAFSLASLFFVYYFVPETGCKSLEDIEHYYQIYYGFCNYLF